MHSHAKDAAALVSFALSLPGAREDFPWGESVAKIGKKIFVFLGRDEKQRERGLLAFAEITRYWRVALGRFSLPCRDV